LNVPGPDAPGRVGRFRNVLRFAHDSIGVTRDLFATYGHVVSLAAGGRTRIYSPLPHCPGTVFTYGPEMVHAVTTQHEIYYKHPLSMGLYPQGEPSPRTRPLKHFGVGLFGVNGDEHRAHRRLLMPAFHKKRIESYRDAMVAATAVMLDRWHPGETLDIVAQMRALTLAVAVKTLFGVDVDAQIGRTVQRIFEAFNLLGAPLTLLLPYDLPGLPYRRFLDLTLEVDRELRAFIARKQAEGTEGDEMMAMLLQARYEGSGMALSDDELLGHTGVILVAGHETSSTALTWTLFLLSQHPAVAADVLDELDAVLHGDAPTVDDLQRLPLLERVVKESLRVLSPVPWNGRVTSQPAELGGYLLPAGTEVFVSIYQTHHMPELFAQPERFDPRRWETLNPSAYAYNPFSAGPRMCIGATFAMLEIRIVLAMLLQRFRLQYLPQIPVERIGLVVLGPKHGMPMRAHAQDRRFAAGAGDVRGNIREMVELPA
jgi:cytochrome P450